MPSLKSPKPRLDVIDGRPMACSLALAADFGVAHSHLLGLAEAVRLLRPHTRFDEDFVPAQSTDAQGHAQPALRISHRGFTNLLIGLSGRQAQRCFAVYTMAFEDLQAELDAGPPGNTRAPQPPRSAPMDGHVAQAMDLLDALSPQARH